MLGKRVHAQTAFDWAMETVTWDENAPDGFKNLSPEAKHGCGRFAILHEDSAIVYKVDPTRRRSILGNEQEYLVARHLHRKYPSGQVGSHCRLPKVGLFSFKYLGEPHMVVSMQYVDGVQGGRVDDGESSLRSLGLADMHGGNFIVDKHGMAWPIDLGSNLRDADFVSPFSDDYS